MSVRETLQRMPLREKCAQLVGFEFRFDAPDYDAAMELARDLGVGGVLVRGGSLFELGPLINALQKVARVPLLVGAAWERGAGREVQGATSFPSHLAVAASGSEELARSKGRLTAREAKAMGVRRLLGAEAEAFAGNEALARAYAAGAAEMKVLAEAVPDLRFPADPASAVAALEADVEAGRLGDAELYQAVERVLTVKQKLGLFVERITDPAGAERIVGAPSHRAAAEKIAEASITRLGDPAAGELLRVCFGDPRGLVPPPHVCAWDDGEVSRRAAARAVAGEIPFAGRWPFNEAAPGA